MLSVNYHLTNNYL